MIAIRSPVTSPGSLRQEDCLKPAFAVRLPQFLFINVDFMPKTSLIFAIVLSVLGTPGLGDTFHRISVSLKRVSNEFQDISINLTLQWGANLAPTERNPNWYEPFSEDPPRRRGSATIKLGPYNFNGPEEVSSVLLYGTITDNGSGDVLRVIPVTVAELKANANDLVEVSVAVERDFLSAFQASYPFRFQRDTGFVTDDTVRHTLVAVRNIIEHSGLNNYELSGDEWDRIGSFFLVNANYFQEGKVENITEILNYFRTFSAISDEPRFQRFYAEFLNTVLGEISDRSVNSLSLHQLVLDDLDTLFTHKLNIMFEQADITLQTLLERKYYMRCVDVGSTILSNIDPVFIEKDVAPNNLRSVLRITSTCGQLLAAQDTGQSPFEVDPAAEYLVDFALGKTMLSNFVSVVDEMDKLGQLRVTNQQDSLLGDYFRAYSTALGGQG